MNNSVLNEYDDDMMVVAMTGWALNIHNATSFPLMNQMMNDNNNQTNKVVKRRKPTGCM